MKICVLGDIHANLEALNAVLAKAKELGAEKYVCIGDVVGYNANPHECLEIVRNLDLIAIVMGNHDSYASNDAEMLGFNPQAAEAVEWTRQQLTAEERKWLAELPMRRDVIVQNPTARFSVVHATLDTPTAWGYIFDRFTAASSLQYQWMPLCFFGHSHTPLAFEKSLSDIVGGVYETIQMASNQKYLVNVGSVGQPRDRDPRAAFVIYDVEKGQIQLHRVEYDIETTQKKILAAGLPERCAARLALGR